MSERGQHPLGAQLSALHRFRVHLDVAVVVVVLVLTNLLAHFTTGWAGIGTVPAAAVGLVILMRCNGLGWAELGLGREHWKSGVGYALAATAVVVTAITVAALLPATRPMFMNHRYVTFSGALLASLIVIPLQTVIPEELAFRGVLHGALAPRLGVSRCRAGGLAAVRLVACGYVVGPDPQQCGLHPALRRRSGGHARRRDAGRMRDGAGRLRVQLAATA